MTDWMQACLIGYLGIGAAWALFGMANYLDADNEPYRPQIARFTLGVVIWPLIVLWFLGWGVGLLFGRLMRDATKKVDT